MRAVLLITLLATAVVATPSRAEDARTREGVALRGGGGSEGRRVRLGSVSAGASYSHGNPWWGPWYPYAWGPYGAAFPGWSLYDPFWYSPYYLHPALYSAYANRDNMGEVKLDTAAKEASVYIDGGFAGTVHDLKNIWLKPGVYNIEVRSFDGRSFERKVYVLSGKTLRVRPELRAAAQEQTR